jgi:hypothetical protein
VKHFRGQVSRQTAHLKVKETIADISANKGQLMDRIAPLESPSVDQAS